MQSGEGIKVSLDVNGPVAPTQSTDDFLRARSPFLYSG